jgi:hypothetical protein
MANDEFRDVPPDIAPGIGEKLSPTARVVVKVIGYVLALPIWFFAGGALSVGPRIAHNIDKAVGSLALDGTFIAWAALPVSGLVALVKSTPVTLRIVGTNIIVWLLFLAYLYNAWLNVYPRAP